MLTTTRPKVSGSQSELPRNPSPDARETAEGNVVDRLPTESGHDTGHEKGHDTGYSAYDTGHDMERTDRDDLQAIELEYFRWKHVRQMMALARPFAKRQKYEYYNVLERWILDHVNFTLDGSDQVFSGAMLIDHPYNRKFVQELIGKEIGLAVPLLEACQSIVASYFRSRDRLEQGERPHVTAAGRISYKTYRRKIPQDRCALLRSKATDLDIAKMTIRYSCIVSRGQQWNSPLENYRHYKNEYGVDVEAFSSPLNSQLMCLGRDASFCSLFPDTDAVFGSIGRFETCDFVGLTVAVGPPFTEEILSRVARVCIESCERAQATGSKVRFLIGFAHWTDLDALNSLLSSRFLVHRQERNKQTYFFVNSNNENRRVVASWNGIRLVLSVGFPDRTYDLYRGMEIENQHDR